MKALRTKRTLAFAALLVLAVILLALLRLASVSSRMKQQRVRQDLPKPKTTEVEVIVEQVKPPSVVTEPKPEPQTETADEPAGVFPPIWCSYREQVGFRRYAAEMERRGAVFFLYSRSKAGWFEIDRSASVLRPFDVRQVGTVYGGKPNCIEDEPALAEFAGTETGSGGEVFLAKPLTMETRIQGTIRQALQARGIALSKVTGIRGVYDFVNGAFSLVVTEIGTRDEGVQGLSLTIPL